MVTNTRQLYLERNKVRITRKRREYEQKNKEAIRERKAAHRKTNLVRIRARERAAYHANPEKGTVKSRNRRALKSNSTGSHTKKEVLQLFKLQQYCCAICECNLICKAYHVDHIMPLIRGGSNDKYNLQITCPACNLNKGAKDPIKFMQSQGRLL